MSLEGFARKDDDSDEEYEYVRDADYEPFLRLSNSATRWFCILRFSSSKQPFQTNYSPDMFIKLFAEKKFTPATLICGMTCKYIRKGVQLPGSAFRTYAYLMDQMRAGRKYTPLNDSDLDRGSPRPNWCKLPVFTQLKEEGAGATSTSTNSRLAEEEMTRQAAWEMLHRATSYCFFTAYSVNDLAVPLPQPVVKCVFMISSKELFQQWESGELNEWTPMVGLLDSPMGEKLWVPPETLLPFGYLLEMHMSGRKYLPLYVNDMKRVSDTGTQYLSKRDIAVLETSLGKAKIPDCPKKMTPQQRMKLANQAASASAAPGGYEAAYPGAVYAQNPGGQTNSSAHLPPPALPTWPEAQTAGPPPPALPIPTPIASHPPPYTPSALSTATSSAPPVNGVQHMSLKEIENPLPNASTILSTTLAPMRPLDRFSTSLFRLFLGSSGQHALGSCWWYMPSLDGMKQGPFSAEQMVLAVIAGLIGVDALVCGMQGHVLPGMVPPTRVFTQLRVRLHLEERGAATSLPTYEEMMGVDTSATRPLPAPGTNLGGGFIMPTPLPSTEPSRSSDVAGGGAPPEQPPSHFPLPMPLPIPVTVTSPQATGAPLHEGTAAPAGQPVVTMNMNATTASATGSGQMSNGAAAYMQFMGSLGLPGAYRPQM